MTQGCEFLSSRQGTTRDGCGRNKIVRSSAKSFCDADNLHLLHRYTKDKMLDFAYIAPLFNSNATFYSSKKRACPKDASGTAISLHLHSSAF